MSIRHRISEKVSKAFEPRIEVVRILELYPLGPEDAESLMDWMAGARALEELIKENIMYKHRLRVLEVSLQKRIFDEANRMVKEINDLFFSDKLPESYVERKKEGKENEES